MINLLLQSDFLEVLHWIVTYVFSSIGLLIMLYLAFLKWKEAKSNPYNVVLLGFFLCFIFGLLATVIYGLFINSNRELAYFFARLSTMIISLGPVFLLFFLLAIDRSFQGMTRKFKIGYFIGWFLAACPMLFIGQVFLSDQSVLSWDYTLAFYVLVYSSTISICIFRLSAITMRKFEKPELKQRFKVFIVGFIIIILVLISIIGVKLNWFTSLVSSIITGLGLIIAPLLIYYGIGKHQ